MGNELHWKNNFNVAVVLLLVLFAHVVNSRPPGSVRATAGRICSKIDKDIYETNDSRWCCNCPKGYRMSGDCRFGRPDTTQCVPCIFDPNDPENQTYIDVENNFTQCWTSITEQDCLKKMHTRFILGSHKEQSRCICEEGYYSTSDAIIYGCNKHSPCDPGYQPEIVGTETTDTKCSNCPAGTYSDVFSAAAKCKPHSKCSSGNIEFEGNSTHDILCRNVPEEMETPTDTPIDQPTIAPIIGTGAVKDGDSRSNPWIMVGPILAVTTLLFIIIVLILKRRYLCGGNGNVKRNAQPSIISDTTSSGRQPDNEPNGESEISELLESHGGPSSGEIDGDDGVSVKISESGNTSVETSRKDTVVTTLNKTNVAKKEIPGNCTGNKTQEFPCGSSEDLIDVIIRLLKQKHLHIISLKVPESSITPIIQTLLKDNTVGIEMLKCLTEYSLKLLRPYIRNFLTDTKIADIESDYNGDQREIRYQLISHTQDVLGRQMTPDFLLNKIYERGSFPIDFRDSMLDVLVKKLQEHVQLISENH